MLDFAFLLPCHHFPTERFDFRNATVQALTAHRCCGRPPPARSSWRLAGDGKSRARKIAYEKVTRCDCHSSGERYVYALKSGKHDRLGLPRRGVGQRGINRNCQEARRGGTRGRVVAATVRVGQGQQPLTRARRVRDLEGTCRYHVATTVGDRVSPGTAC